MEKGLEQGLEQKLISLVCKKLAKGKTPDEIADALEEPKEHIEQICAVARKFAPEYETDRIYDALKNEKRILH